MINGHGDDTYHYRNIRLNFSSNIPTFVDLSALEEHLRTHLSVIRSYPEPSAHALEAKIAHLIGKNPAQVMVTSGATEAIYMIAQAVSLLSPGASTYTVVHPTFSEYDSACQMFGLQNHPFDEEEREPRGEVGGETLCWLCNPNNPTGEFYDEAYVRDLAQCHRWLVIDQSYEDYTLRRFEGVDELPNVICLHSMTKKYCIPGLRLGYITASAEVIDVLRRFCRPWAVNALAIEAGMWLMDHRPQLIDMPAYLDEAQRLRNALNNVPGIHVRETQTNFMLCSIEGCTAAELKDYLAKEYGILIRDASNFPTLTPHHFRVAAQRPEDNDELVKILRQIRTHAHSLSADGDGSM